jgi:tripartite-type tricarboxylate transporter receptor subunit TctC
METMVSASIKLAHRALRLAILALPALLAAACGISSAGAQDAVADFFRGRQVAIIVGSSAGGGYDTYARLIARYLGSHIAGNPTVVVQNMPGAGSAKSVGYINSVAPKDGTAIAAFYPPVILAPMLEDASAPFDPNKLNYLGSANSDTYLCLLRSDAPAQTFADTFSHEVILGASAEGGTTRDLPAMLNNLIGTRFRIVTGYAGSKEITLAVERNEVHGTCGIGWTGLPTMHPDWFAKKVMRVIVQLSMTGHPDLNKMGVPLAAAYAKTDEERQVMELAFSQGSYGRPYVMPPGVPAERIAALRKAFMDTLHDPALLADAEKAQLDIDAMSGDDLQALVKKLYSLSPAIVARAKQALIYKPPQ